METPMRVISTPKNGCPNPPGLRLQLWQDSVAPARLPPKFWLLKLTFVVGESHIWNGQNHQNPAFFLVKSKFFPKWIWRYHHCWKWCPASLLVKIPPSHRATCGISLSGVLQGPRLKVWDCFYFFFFHMGKSNKHRNRLQYCLVRMR